jgi:hypothetical protein
LLLNADKSFEVIDPENETQKTIDVWWQNDDTSRLMLLLSYLITRNKGWESVQIRLLVTNYDQDNKDNMDKIIALLEEIRIKADPVIIPDPDSKKIIQLSKETDLVFLPIKLENNKPVLFSNEPVNSVLPSLKTCILSLSAQKIELDADPEDGLVKEMAAIYDQFQLAEKKVELAEKYALRLAEEAKEKIADLKFEKDSDQYSLKQKITEALETREKAVAANKRAEREKEKLLKAEDDAKTQGISTDKK